MIESIKIDVSAQGLHEITHQIERVVRQSDVNNGLCTVFVQHTSASLIIQENADPSAKHDLENWLNRLVPEHDPLYTHTFEGADDMPAHIKSAITATSIAIPVMQKRLALGTWQGLYLWEHRKQRGQRTVIIHVA
ncbi:MAG: secondary thiamine-phosphate synthase enzyme YjbQ [gamma proteobacterium symbiont of Bathyaustriella thionipta]|nr:secondary thiamine-phosphate synthase enzyme YjbQ [gamma proteobacterium symbiont of Bathyaustriella thionipta]MCU7948925.1 secondary thiamine-phosphate synthase enzyme YjbQ [gamma proteobacterium symbiont of Bathyaustriella thionipta]MCU7954314.1 secondary thiamine-phosphate synthase enzyme YjbQ [gamma proteobacterium symbiont of Bathyaustriella thionipta]MCU7955632.1 secondary thiamine-phosphate synthase enzyme YjbQ [gamma proteobacterium symbiont of Bathyaustriella thionipta]MCU7966634.1 